MNSYFKNFILKTLGAKDLIAMDKIQDLWSGYGSIVRYRLTRSKLKTIIVKHIRLPEEQNHKRGWNTNLSHERKIKSYKIENSWYLKWNRFCDENCYTPRCYAAESYEDETIILLEDLDASGFEIRKTSISLSEIETCLRWLANFHATFMGQEPTHLWKVGTYWHLETRPDELEALSDESLKNSASIIDQKLSSSPFQTFVHGDAKLANFCFSKNGKKVAAVDFQYVGGGCGMKDVSYFIGSCLGEDECERLESQLLDFYFHSLKNSLIEKEKNIEIDSLIHNWRDLYPVAWTDFHRFIKGWSPGHWKINSYSEKISKKVLESL